jgi:hypothetical protein
MKSGKSFDVSKTKQSPAKSAIRTEHENESELVFSKSNYMLMIAGLGFIALGFILMAGGGSDDPNVFDRSMFSFRRITLAPILVLIGFVIEIFAIMKKPDHS